MACARGGSTSPTQTLRLLSSPTSYPPRAHNHLPISPSPPKPIGSTLPSDTPRGAAGTRVCSLPPIALSSFAGF
ncbi:hypothetical protein FKM82_000119 [Ascaphus truei]